MLCFTQYLDAALIECYLMNFAQKKNLSDDSLQYL